MPVVEQMIPQDSAAERRTLAPVIRVFQRQKSLCRFLRKMKLPCAERVHQLLGHLVSRRHVPVRVPSGRSEHTEHHAENAKSRKRCDQCAARRRRMQDGLLAEGFPREKQHQEKRKEKYNRNAHRTEMIRDLHVQRHGVVPEGQVAVV